MCTFYLANCSYPSYTRNCQQVMVVRELQQPGNSETFTFYPLPLPPLPGPRRGAEYEIGVFKLNRPSLNTSEMNTLQGSLKGCVIFWRQKN